MPDFLPGLELARLLYVEAVRPILDADWPGLDHGAALLGPGSEVLGFDDATSTDHSWGPRLQLFLAEADHARLAGPITATLSRKLPRTLRGYPVSFLPPTPEEPGTQMPDFDGAGEAVHHRVEVVTLRGFVCDILGFDPAEPLTPADWLSFPAQKLRSLTAGAIFHDAVGLGDLRARLSWYPHDVWLYLLAAGWARIGQEEHLMGRAGSVGDELGSALIGARLVRDGMRLAFLMERQYAPYPKWFGTAFRQLACAGDLLPALDGALAARDWRARERHLGVAYEALARQHNALGLTPPLDPALRPFHTRPFRVIGAERFAEALNEAITDPAVRALAARPLIGSVDQFSDSTDLLEGTRWRSTLRGLWGQSAAPAEEES